MTAGAKKTKTAGITKLPSGKYQATIDLNGVRKKKSWVTEQDAIDWKGNEEAAIRTKATGNYVAPKGNIAALIDSYVTTYGNVNGGWSTSKQYCLDKLKKDIGQIEVKNFGKQAAIKYGMQLAETRGPVGVSERMHCLSKVFKVAKDENDIETPVEALRSAIAVLTSRGVLGMTDPRDRIIEPHETATIKAKLSDAAAEIVDVLNILPFRVGELCEIKWAREDLTTGKVTSDFNEIDRSVRLFRKDTSKGKKTFRRVEWVILPEIETVQGGKIVVVDTFDLLFKRPHTGEGPLQLTGKEMSRQFSFATAASGFGGEGGIHLHDYRAEAISSLLSQGISDLNVAKLSGHKDMKVFHKHYDRQKPRKLHELFKRQLVANRQARAA